MVFYHIEEEQKILFYSMLISAIKGQIQTKSFINSQKGHIFSYKLVNNHENWMRNEEVLNFGNFPYFRENTS